MASNAVIGALRIVIGADSAALDKGLRDAESSLSSFSKTLGTTLVVAAAALATAGAAMAVSLKGAVDQADNLGKAAQKFGVPVEELSKLKHAADLSDVSLETLGTSLGKLSKNMVEAAAKPTSEAALAFNALGVSVKGSDGSLKSSSVVLADLADRFSVMKDGAGKTAAAMAVFGRSGAEIIPLLNSGRDGLQQMADEAAKLGLVITEKTAKAAEAFNDNLTRLGKVKEGIVTILAAKMLPAMESLTNRMVEVAKETNVVETVSNALVKAFEFVSRGVMLVADNMDILIKAGAVFIGARIAVTAIEMAIAFSRLALAVYETGLVMTVFNAIKKMTMFGMLLLAGAITTAIGGFDNLKNAMGEVAEKVKKLLPDDGAAATDFLNMLSTLGVNIRALKADLTGANTAATEMQTGWAAQASALGTMSQSVMVAGQQWTNYTAQTIAQKGALDQYIDSLAKQQAGMQADILTTGLAIGEKERLRIQLQGNAIAEANGAAMTEKQRLALEAASLKAKDYAMSLAGIQMTQQNLSPMQQYEQKLKDIQSLFDSGKISAETYSAAQQKAAESAGATWESAGANMAGAIQNVSGVFAKENKSMAIASKAAGIVLAIINAYTAASKALATLPPPFSYAAAAAALAQGFAYVASIKSTSVGGFATGGSFTVPGGVGGGDSVMAAFEPGERVDVWRPGEGGADRRSGGGEGQTLTLNLQGENFGRETLRKIATGIEQLVGDGFKINLNPA